MRKIDEALTWWGELEDKHEAMTAAGREDWYETEEGGLYLSLLNESWREDWEEVLEAAYPGA